MTLIELSIVITLVGILATLSYVGLTQLTRKSRVSTGASELVAQIASGRSHAIGKDIRVALLFNAGPAAGTENIRYWLVEDPWFTLDETMAATGSWAEPSNLAPPSPAPAGARYRVMDHGTFANGVRLHATGFKDLVGSSVKPACGAYSGKITLTSGVTDSSAAGGGYFPPPYCAVPDASGCTFCSTAGSLRGGIFFEPDGRVTLVDGAGSPTPAGAGSLAFSAADLPIADARAVAFTSSGLVRLFRPNE
jgi:prepilin-type N-terminal cleavage/methylation domain-containing protein